MRLLCCYLHIMNCSLACLPARPPARPPARLVEGQYRGVGQCAQPARADRLEPRISSMTLVGTIVPGREGGWQGHLHT